MQIFIDQLTKTYPNGKTAIENIDLQIESGMFGLLGPNGAGKTTLMRILVTLMEPSRGKVQINGWDLIKDRRQIRSVLGYLPQDFRFFSKLSTWEFLDYVAALAGLKRKAQRRQAVDEMLEKVGLFDVRDRAANKLSGGMKRRLGIAQALIGDPKIVIVDEPTTGLDPEERIRFRNLLSDLSQKEVVIILSTHIVGDISSACHQMALLHQGHLAYHGSPEALVERAKGHVWRIQALDHDLDRLNQAFPVIATIPAENGWEVEVVAQQINGYAAEPVDPNLEHAYVYFMEYEVGHVWHDQPH